MISFFTFGTWAAMVGVIITIGALADGFYKQAAKDKVVEFLEFESQNYVSKLVSAFVKLFDYFFGEKRLSTRLVIGSFLATLVSFAVMGRLLWDPSVLVAIDRWRALGPDSNTWEFLVSVVILLNLIPDLLSLTETRWMLGKVEGKPSAAGRFLLLDALLTFAIYAFSLVVALSFTYGAVDPDYLRETLSMGTGIGSTPQDAWVTWAFKTSLATTFVTSVWLWLFVGGGVLVRAAVWFDRTKKRKLLRTYYKTQPCLALAFGAAILFSMLYVPAVLLGLIG